MRVLHVLKQLSPSGAEVMLKLAAKHWLALGYGLGVLSTGPEPGDYAGTLGDAGYEVHHLPLETRGSFFSRDKWQALIGLFSAYDVVHIHTEAKAPFLAFAARCAGRKGVVRTVHNNFSFPTYIRTRLKFERRFARALGTRHIAISPSVARTERTEFNNPTHMILNWIDSAHYRPPTPQERREARERLRIRAGRRLLVSVGNGSDIKNYRAIIEAMGEIADPSLLYYQVGNPHPTETDRSVAEGLGLQQQVKFCGPVRDPRPFLWACDLYLMPSKFEGFGLSAAEALACGLDVVFAKVPGLLDWEHHAAGVYWSDTSPRSVREAISSWMANEGDRSSNMETAEKVRRLLSPGRGAEEHDAFYRSMLEGQG